MKGPDDSTHLVEQHPELIRLRRSGEPTQGDSNPTVFRDSMRHKRSGVRMIVSSHWWVGFLLAAILSGCAQTEKRSEPSEPSGPKRVVIDKTHQMLRAYEGEQLILESRISTGREGRRTPNGQFNVGVKWRMHYSTLYNDAPMPYSVQVSGNYFVHGYSSVPNRPASHGCIRLPLTGSNPAREFFEWVEPGTPIAIVGRWQG